jgi:ATP-dependent exoDNAse (exonuclease V) alpha subunit
LSKSSENAIDNTKMLEEIDKELENKDHMIRINEIASKSNVKLVIILEFLRTANNYALKILNVLRIQNKLEYQTYDKLKEKYGAYYEGLGEKIKEYKEGQYKSQTQAQKIKQEQILQKLEDEIFEVSSQISKTQEQNDVLDQVICQTLQS